MKEIRKIGTHQTSKVLAVTCMLMSLLFVIPLTIWTVFFTEPKPHWSSLVMLLIPLLYGIFGYIFYAICILFYNIAANLVGGMEMEIEE